MRKSANSFAAFFLGLLCFGSLSFAQAKVEEIALPFSIAGSPQIYDGAFYVFAIDKRFVKLNEFGHDIWQIPRSATENCLAAVKFNTLFFLASDGGLECFDSRFGYKKWEQRRFDIKKIQASYPFIFYLDAKGHIGALDFLSGLPEWDHDVGALDFVFLPNAGKLVALRKNDLQIFEATDDMVAQTKPLPVASDAVLSAGKESVFLLQNGALRLYNIFDSSLKNTEKSLRAENCLVDDHYLIELSENSLKKSDLQKNRAVWSRPIEKLQKIDKIFFGENCVLLASGLKAQLFDLSEEKKAPLSFDFPASVSADIKLVAPMKSGYYVALKDRFLAVTSAVVPSPDATVRHPLRRIF